MTDYKYVIVGAGLSGLTIAERIAKTGRPTINSAKVKPWCFFPLLTLNDLYVSFVLCIASPGFSSLMNNQCKDIFSYDNYKFCEPDIQIKNILNRYYACMTDT